MRPIKLKASLKNNIWGGRRLIDEYGKESDLEIVAESWELSMHQAGESTVLTGEDKGLKLSEYIKKYGNKILGIKAENIGYFPLLIKFIDAKQNLSIQVHPNDEYAFRVEGEPGKTEMWYILDCDDDSFLYYGFNRDVTKNALKEKIEDNTVLEILNKVKVHKGDVFFIPSGTVHAICAGIVICEIQQNSNTTYRLYDYDRRDAMGNKRELHIQKALDVAKLTKENDNLPSEKVKIFDGFSKQKLAECKYFCVTKFDVKKEVEISITSNCFHSIVVTNGIGTLIFENDIMNIKKGESIFIPAQDGKYKIIGECEIILSYLS